jgi:hypothetical protein
MLRLIWESTLSTGPRGLPGFAIRVPIERSGEVTAVLSSVIRPAIITDLLFAGGLPSSWSAWVVDGQERLVTSTGAPTLAGGQAAAFATFSGSSFGTGQLEGGSELRVAEVSLQNTPWKVRVGLPVSEHQALSNQATLLLLRRPLSRCHAPPSAWPLLSEASRSQAAQASSVPDQETPVLGPNHTPRTTCAGHSHEHPDRGMPMQCRPHALEPISPPQAYTRG